MTVVTRAPTADSAGSGTWDVPLGSRYSFVNDFPDSVLSYLQHGTTAGAQMFTFGALNIPAGSTAISVAVKFYDQEPANGNNNSNARLTVGGTAYDSTSHNPTTTATLRTKTWATNPRSGVAWTVNDVNGVGANALTEFGLSSTDANPVYYIYSIQLEVTYTPPSSQTLSPGGMASAEAFGTATVTGGATVITPSGIASAQAFGSAKLTLTLTPGGIASAQAFGSAKLTTKLLPSGIASAEVFGTAKLTTRVTPSGIGSAEAFGPARVDKTGGTQTLTPSGIPGAEAFGTAKFTQGVNLNIGTRLS